VLAQQRSTQGAKLGWVQRMRCTGARASGTLDRR
jgi:hypothetical protein